MSEDARRMRKLRRKIKPVLALEKEYRNKTDEELKAMTPYLRQKLEQGASLDDIYVEAFATAREACWRVLHEYPYVEQLIGGTVIHGGDVSEQKTGEGKSETAIMPVYLNALGGQGVHVITVNEYLSERDSQWIGQIYEWLGLTVGLNKAGMAPSEKKKAYAADVTFTTNSEAGFDYLRDNMVLRPEDRVQRGLNFALIDEVDSILIDDSRTPLIISGMKKHSENLYLMANTLCQMLRPQDYDYDIKTKSVTLTDSGISMVEQAFGVRNLYDPKHFDLVHHINNALKANFAFKKDVDYMVDRERDEILIIDPNTGRTMEGRQWSDGLHQAVEAKERITIKDETMTVATITYQNFFRLYNKLAGMTGTAKTEEEEFLDVYNMYVVPVPTHRPVIRIDNPDLIYATKRRKYEAILEEVKRIHKTGQPILLGTISVETSELLSDMLSKKGIPHETLNAKNHKREADIIAMAGQKGAVTIATNMAGRGTDIKLGEGVKELGGLFVIGSERHESRRIDNQLRGRSGRQGDPGESRFFVSMEDDLMLRFGSDKIEKQKNTLGDDVLESKLLSKMIENAQKRVEGMNYDSRKQLLKYDDVMRRQRETMYATRNKLVDDENVHTFIYNMFAKVVNDMRVAHETDAETAKALNDFGFHIHEGSDSEMLQEEWARYEAKIEPVKEDIDSFERQISLGSFDRAWSSQIDAMAKLKNAIGLRGYASKDPINDYVDEGYLMFNAMSEEIARNVVDICLRLRIEEKEPGNQ